MKLSATGRGKHFSKSRAPAEKVEGVIYARGWPGRLWDRA